MFLIMPRCKRSPWIKQGSPIKYFQFYGIVKSTCYRWWPDCSIYFVLLMNNFKWEINYLDWLSHILIINHKEIRPPKSTCTKRHWAMTFFSIAIENTYFGYVTGQWPFSRLLRIYTFWLRHWAMTSQCKNVCYTCSLWIC